MEDLRAWFVSLSTLQQFGVVVAAIVVAIMLIILTRGLFAFALLIAIFGGLLTLLIKLLLDDV